MTDRILLNLVTQYLIAPPKQDASLLSQIVHYALSVPLARSIPEFHSHRDTRQTPMSSSEVSLSGDNTGDAYINTMGGGPSQDTTALPSSSGVRQTLAHSPRAVTNATSGYARSALNTMGGVPSHDRAVRNSFIPTFMSPKGRLVAVNKGPLEKSVRIQNIHTRKFVELEGCSDAVYSVAFSPDGKRVVTGGEMIQIWDAETGKLTVAVMNEDRYNVLSVAFSPDGKRVASGSAGKTVRIWNSATGAPDCEFKCRSPVLSVSFSPDGNYVVSGERRGRVVLWNTITKKKYKESKVTRNALRSVAYSMDGKSLVVVGRRVEGHILDAKTLSTRSTNKKLVNAISAVFSPDGRRIIGAIPGGAGVQIVGIDNPNLDQSIPGPNRRVAISQDGKYIAGQSIESTFILTNEISLNDLEGVIKLSESDRKKREQDDSINTLLNLKERLTAAGIDVAYMREKLNDHINQYKKPFYKKYKTDKSDTQNKLAIAEMYTLFQHGLLKYLPVQLDKYYVESIINA